MLQVRTEYGVLPADHPQRASALLGRAISQIEAGQPEQAKEVLSDMAEVATGEVYAGGVHFCLLVAIVWDSACLKLLETTKCCHWD